MRQNKPQNGRKVCKNSDFIVQNLGCVQLNDFRKTAKTALNGDFGVILWRF